MSLLLLLFANDFNLSDGSDEASLVALKASTELEKAAALLAGADDEDLELAEQRIEDALEALLDAEIAGNEDDGMVRLTKAHTGESNLHARMH